MKPRILIPLFLVFLLLPSAAFAQFDAARLLNAARPAAVRQDTSVTPADTQTVGRADLEVYEAAMYYTQRLDSLTRAYRRWHYNGADTLSNPFYTSLFAKPNLLPGTLRRSIGSLPPTYGADDPQMARAQAIDRALIYIYGERPWLVRRELPDVAPTETPTRPAVPVTPSAVITPTAPRPAEPVNLVSPDFGLQVHRPNFWTFKADLSLQFMQNYISENWYKGGESNNSFLANAVLEANYDNKRKITFSNKLEMKLGFYSSKSDSVHRYKTNNDLLRLTNKLGLQATKHWYYTVMLQSWTQFYHGYKANNPKLISDFLSPFECVLSFGMDYKLSVKNFKLEATLSPFAARYKYVRHWDLATSFGIDEGHHTNLDYGSTITATATWTPLKNVTWKSRLYWFTDYDKTTVEWENTISFKINDYLNTQLFLYPRFDDGVARKDDHSYFQFKEYLSLGFNFKF
ncbi:MAG: DUF3078 domain-containing protein [Bacteroidaceae bacterium]|nr:DUF3078 domain-containing protein [Bacteroidaceae bacterium]